jgi:hypothetical protein
MIGGIRNEFRMLIEDINTEDAGDRIWKIILKCVWGK